MSNQIRGRFDRHALPRRVCIAVLSLATAGALLTACSLPGTEDTTTSDGTPTIQPTPEGTRAAIMPIVTPTPVTAGEPAGPGTPETTTEVPATYVVQENDSLYAIALRFSVELNVLITANGLSDPNDIQIGQELIIPTATP